MSKTIWTGTATAIVAAATVAAMAQAPGAQQSSSESSADKRITVTGCLKAAPPTAADASTTAAPTGTTGTAGAPGAASAAADTKFLLSDATTSPASSAPSASSSTTAASQASAAQPAQTYRLIANAASLSPHVGKKLELTGTVEDQASTSTTSSGPASGPALRVEAGKVIAASCD